MSLAQYNKTLAEDFISLKNKIKTECARRNQEGSVAQYGVDEYWDSDPEQFDLMDYSKQSSFQSHFQVIKSIIQLIYSFHHHFEYYLKKIYF